MSPLPTIDCKDCGHVNEGERVYCHNCGTKLDRSQLASLQDQNESAKEKQRRIKKLMNPNSGFIEGWWKELIKAIIYAAITAAVVDIVLPPEEVPAMLDKGVFLDAPDLGLALENLAGAPAGQRVRFLQDEINAYLKSKVRIRYDGSILQNLMTYQRTFVNLDAGTCRITAQSGIDKYPIYAGLTYRLMIENKELVATPVGANLGRLHIPAEAVQYIGEVFNPLWDALQREHKLMGQVGSVEIRKGEMILSSRGPAPHTMFTPASTPLGSVSLPQPSLKMSSISLSGSSARRK